MNRDALLDELRKIEHEVVESERQLAEQEAMLVELSHGGERGMEVEAAREILELMREHQRKRQQDRLRLLSLLQR